jgi:hypothetical protein
MKQPTQMTEVEAALHFGTLPTQRPGETQDDANKRILLDMRKAMLPLPDPGTPLGEWARRPGSILTIGEQRDTE